MKIAVTGGGPGGLFFAVMMQRADRSHAITVFERNAANATFGFGVVFPERSLRYLRDADQETHEAFTRACISWDAIEYRHRGRVLRCGGHTFSGIARIDLLAILQQRAGELGVDLRFEQAVGDLQAVAGYDLVVAADGINSAGRRAMAHRFRPSIHVGRSRYIWLGTTKPFDALTFIFEENDHGWFGAHIYPYSATASTFIVETDEATWRRAGLDREADAAQSSAAAEQATLAYCERLFARHLEGHPLLADTSRWSNFRTVRNRVWHADRLVLLGDAAHTAHFSVGSGTRMAMEDAIALAHALGSHAEVGEALGAYERERQPAVGRTQRAAEPSRRWWEQFRHWAHLAPEQFAVHHLTRTRVLSYGTLKVRDPQFMSAVEGWLTRGGGVTPSSDAGAQDHQPLATPLRLGEVVFPNRLVALPPDDPHGSADDPWAWHLRWLGNHAHAGAGLVLTAPTPVSREAGTPGVAGLWAREHVEAWRRVTEAVRARSPVRIGLHLGGVPADAPAARLLDHLSTATAWGGEAGFDFVLLDGASLPQGEGGRAGPHSGLSPLLSDLVGAARAAWPTGRPIGVHFPAWSDPEDDRSVEAGLELARSLKARGCDVLAVSVSPGLVVREEAARVAQIYTVETLRNVPGISTMVLGGLYTVGDVNALILSGRADLCEWPRLAWPAWRPPRASGNLRS